MKYGINEAVELTSAPPIPLTALWSASYSPPSPSLSPPAHPTSTAYTALINLAQGIPGSFPPKEFLERLSDQGGKGENCAYGDGYGEPELRRAITRDVNRFYREEMDKGDSSKGLGGEGEGEEGGLLGWEDCCITTGANAAFYMAVTTLAGAGDEIILTDPFYFNHHMTLTQLSITPIPLPTPSPTFLPLPTTLLPLLTQRTKALILVSPNNPTGAIYPPALLEEFADICRERGIALVLDETYREFGNGERGGHGLFRRGDWRDYLIHIFSFSKSYAIPSHRLGLLLASPVFLEQLMKVLDSSSINSNRAAQKAAAWAVEGIRPWREEMRREILGRGELLEKLIGAMEAGGGGRWEVVMRGGYYAWIKHPFPQIPSRTIAEQLAKHVGLVVLPGSFFSFPIDSDERRREDRYLRFSVANVSSEILQHVPGRLARFGIIWNSLPPLDRLSLGTMDDGEQRARERIEGC